MAHGNLNRWRQEQHRMAAFKNCRTPVRHLAPVSHRSCNRSVADTGRLAPSHRHTSCSRLSTITVTSTVIDCGQLGESLHWSWCQLDGAHCDATRPPPDIDVQSAEHVSVDAWSHTSTPVPRVPGSGLHRPGRRQSHALPVHRDRPTLQPHASSSTHAAACSHLADCNCPDYEWPCG